jgi:hypothetical protein
LQDRLEHPLLLSFETIDRLMLRRNSYNESQGQETGEEGKDRSSTGRLESDLKRELKLARMRMEPALIITLNDSETLFRALNAILKHSGQLPTDTLPLLSLQTLLGEP